MWIAREPVVGPSEADCLVAPGKGDLRLRSDATPLVFCTDRTARYTGGYWAASGSSGQVGAKTLCFTREDPLWRGASRTEKSALSCVVSSGGSRLA
jgi:phage gp46-like protein